MGKRGGLLLLRQGRWVCLGMYEHMYVVGMEVSLRPRYSTHIVGRSYCFSLSVRLFLRRHISDDVAGHVQYRTDDNTMIDTR